MSEVYTYQELRELALKHGIRDNKVHIGVWIQTQGYQKQRIQINHIRKTFPDFIVFCLIFFKSVL